jgi:hypothetical protein
VTPACGTGSTAAAYVCARIGRASWPVRVRLRGGELMIDARGDAMTMRGSAEYMRPFALEWSADGVLLQSSLDSPTMRPRLQAGALGP